MVCGEMADAAPCDDGWLAMGWRASRGELAGRWLAGSRRMLRRGQRMARSEMADAVQGVARCCAERRQMACREPPDVVPCVQMIYGPSAGGAIGRWRVEGRRMLRRKQADGAWRAGELPAEGAQGLYLARKSYSPFRQKGYSSGETGLLSIIPSYLKKSVDEDRANEDTNFRCETRRYLSWIEGLTTNQYVGGSNPSRRTIETAGHRGFYLGGFFVFTGSFRPVGAIWVLSAAHRTLRSLSIAAALGL